jgi:hypothetical protein
MTSWDTYLYTRDFDALNKDREMRQATKLLTYPHDHRQCHQRTESVQYPQGWQDDPRGTQELQR